MAHILIVRSLYARNDGTLTAAETVIAYAPVHDTDPVGILWALRNLVACLVLGHLEEAGITLTGVSCLAARAYLLDTGTMAADVRLIAVSMGIVAGCAVVVRVAVAVEIVLQVVTCGASPVFLEVTRLSRNHTLVDVGALSSVTGAPHNRLNATIPTGVARAARGDRVTVRIAWANDLSTCAYVWGHFVHGRGDSSGETGIAGATTGDVYAVRIGHIRALKRHACTTVTPRGRLNYSGIALIARAATRHIFAI